MAGGAPTKYNKDIPDKAREYIKSCVDKFEFDEKTGKITGIGVKLPTAEGLALCLDIHRRTLYKWAKRHKEFRHILEGLNQLQAERLIAGGLAGKYNATIAKLVLAKHGYKEELRSEEKIKLVRITVNKKERKTIDPKKVSAVRVSIKKPNATAK